jgi:hypothetical protein
VKARFTASARCRTDALRSDQTRERSSPADARKILQPKAATAKNVRCALMANSINDLKWVEEALSGVGLVSSYWKTELSVRGVESSELVRYHHCNYERLSVRQQQPAPIVMTLVSAPIAKTSKASFSRSIRAIK